MAATLVSPDQAPGEGFLIVKVEDSWEQDCAPEVPGEAETYRQRFRHFCYPMEAGPHAALSQLWELCCRWLRPELRSKEQILEQLVLEQFLSALPEELQARVRERQPKSGRAQSGGGGQGSVGSPGQETSHVSGGTGTAWLPGAAES